MTKTCFQSEDHIALDGLVRFGGALCTIVAIDGSFSRRCGAQLAVHSDGSTSGDLADSCLEAALVEDARIAMQEGTRQIARYGKGSSKIDFRLPCGGGLDILIDPMPDYAICKEALSLLNNRQPLRIALPVMPNAGRMAIESDEVVHDRRAVFSRPYVPSLRLIVAGAGLEPHELCRLAQAMDINTTHLFPIERGGNGQLSLGRAPVGVDVDSWTAIILLFHDHEWEEALLRWALATPAMLIGAQGGAKARENRHCVLSDMGYDQQDIARVKGPIGLIPNARTPRVLALSVLAECVARYEQLLSN